MKRLGRKSVFGTPRSVVFIKNACSGLPEALFFSKTIETPLVSRVFFSKTVETPLVSCVFFSKTDVPTPWTGLTIKNILQCGYS